MNFWKFYGPSQKRKSRDWANNDRNKKNFEMRLGSRNPEKSLRLPMNYHDRNRYFSDLTYKLWFLSNWWKCEESNNLQKWRSSNQQELCQQKFWKEMSSERSFGICFFSSSFAFLSLYVRSHILNFKTFYCFQFIRIIHKIHLFKINVSW